MTRTRYLTTGWPALANSPESGWYSSFEQTGLYFWTHASGKPALTRRGWAWARPCRKTCRASTDSASTSDSSTGRRTGAGKPGSKSALACLRPKCTPTIIVGWCGDTLPCDWHSHRLYTDHAVNDEILNKSIHQFLHFSPAAPTTTSTGSTNMISLRVHAATEFEPVLRADDNLPNRVFVHHCTGLSPFSGVYLLYVAWRGTLSSTHSTVSMLLPQCMTRQGQ